ncbi:hypothetical protein [Pseudomaricurvus sp.]|uniref:hypothetical protein n=1 Tax=Pseudomaricurvus sp. TaxID=2004510 RepID=UPI003F6D1AB8
MTENRDAEDLLSTPQEQETTEPPQGLAGAADTWSDWIQQATTAGSKLAELFTLELQLALTDARRMLFLLILALPILFLAWFGFACLIAWLIGDYWNSVALGLLGFLILQLGVLLLMRGLWRRYKRSLSLPLTREHLQAFMGDASRGDTSTREADHNEARTPDT